MPTLFALDLRGLTPDALEARLTEAGVSTAVDVRAVTGGSDLSEARLAERLEGAGVGYVRLDGSDPVEDQAVLRGLALDEDVCLLGDGHEGAAAERLARATGHPVVRLRGA